MKASLISALLFGGAIAAPAAGLAKRSVVIEEVVVTDWVTTTIFVDAPSATASGAQFAFPSGFKASVSSVSAASASSASVAVVAPSSSAAPPPPVLAAVATPTPTPAPAAAPAAAPAPAPAAPASGGGPSGTGDITFYELGLTSCGQTYSDSDAVVALSHSVMNNGANSNNNPLCNQAITITYNGVTVTGKVVDTCEGCDSNSIDLSPSLFQQLAPLSAGRVSGVSWSVA